MAADSETLLRYIRRLVSRPAPDGYGDADLLGRFISARDEKAFAALVDRHGPLVLQVCRRVLVNVHDAEDAYQAAFLVLARKASTVHPPEALAAWLHAVAHRVALKARSAKVRQLRQAQPLESPPTDQHPDPLAELSTREMLAVVDEEVRRLPKVYRLPVILCCLEGRSQEEAARQLGWTPGSVRGRLERGRARLHARLLRRGLTLSAALAAAEVSTGATSAVEVAALVAPTVRAALAFAARQTAAGGVSVQAVAWAGDVIKAMSLAKLKTIAGLTLATCLLAAGFLAYKMADSPSATAPRVGSPALNDRVALAAPAALARKELEAPPDDFNARIKVNGRVVDPEGEPFAGANLYLGYSRRSPAFFTPRQTLLAYPRRTTTGADGRFSFAFAKSELDGRLFLDPSRLVVLATANSYGPDWVVIGDSAREVELNLKLVKDLPVNGRILDQNRQPVAGAKVFVVDVTSGSEEAMTRYLQGDSDSWSGKTWTGPLPEQAPAVTTDADGRFRLTGLGRDRILSLALEGPGIQHAFLLSATRPPTASPYFGGINGSTFEYVAAPSRPIRGVVRDRATGEPVAGVKISSTDTISTRLTDRDGGYELSGCPKSDGHIVTAQPQAGQPYFAASGWMEDGPGLDALTLNFDLVRGIPLRGHVTDQATGKPPKTAVVEYYPLFPNSHSGKISNGPNMAASSVLLQPDGCFSMVVLPGPGVVCVAASPRHLYTVAMVDDHELANLFHDGISHSRGSCPFTAVGPGGKGTLIVNKYNALSLINPNEGAAFLALDLTVQPARPLKGTVVGLDGQPLTGVKATGLTAMSADELLEGASFTVMALNPRRARDLSFHHKAKRLGKVLTIPGDQTEPLTVQLEPCGSVAGRLMHKDGKPVSGETVAFGLSPYSPEAKAETDRQGYFRVENLMPGQKYWFVPQGSHRLLKDVGEVLVQPGQSRDLGTLVLED